jgi:DNA invertase Pin-like site-specific DNA recombinase
VAEGWEVVARCTDDGYSGATLDRPGLDQVRDLAASRSIDALVALCPDRLARNYLHQALVLDELGRFGTSVLFVEGGLADDPHGRLVAQIQAAVAEFERSHRSTYRSELLPSTPCQPPTMMLARTCNQFRPTQAVSCHR